MAFPLNPILQERHTEESINYRWTGSSWDVVSDFQELILSTADPINGTNTAPEGAIWRNTTTGSAWQYTTSGQTLDSPQYFVYNNLTASSGVSWGNPTHKRQSFTLSSAVRVNDIKVSLRRSAGTASGTITMYLYNGSDSTTSPSSPVSSLGLGSLIQSVTVNDTTTTAATYSTVTFTFNKILPAGTYTFLLLSSATTGDLVAGRSTTTYSGGFRDANAADLAFSLSATPASYSSGWKSITHSPSIQIGTVSPTAQESGSSLVVGDLWYNTTAGFEGLAYWTGTGWVAIRTFYDPTLQNVFAQNDNQGVIDEIDAIVDRLETGINFIGTYNPITNQADFTTLSGLTDGTLPAASTVGNSFLVVIRQAVGQSPAPVVQMNRGDFLVADPVANTWTLASVGDALEKFTEYFDVPSTYVGAAKSNLLVNATEDGLEFGFVDDTQSIRSAGAPTERPSTEPLHLGDQWLDTTTNNEKHWDGADWRNQVYVRVTDTTTAPSSPVSGTLWYDKTTSTLFIWDTLANRWVAV